MSSIDTDRFRDLLVAERERVQVAIDHIRKDHPGSLEDETGEETSFDNHLGDSAAGTYDREFDYTLEDNDEVQLGRIDAALERITDGSYGTCRRCGRQIAPERLEARPWAELCIDCQREVERG